MKNSRMKNGCKPTRTALGVDGCHSYLPRAERASTIDAVAGGRSGALEAGLGSPAARERYGDAGSVSVRPRPAWKSASSASDSEAAVVDDGEFQKRLAQAPFFVKFKAALGPCEVRGRGSGRSLDSGELCAPRFRSAAAPTKRHQGIGRRAEKNAPPPGQIQIESIAPTANGAMAERPLPTL